MLGSAVALTAAVFEFSPTRASADNNDFLATLATLPHGSTTFYNCEIEVGSETVDPTCQLDCERRLFLSVQRSRPDEILLVAIFRDESRESEWLRSKERHYLAAFDQIIGQPRISGVLRTGFDGRIHSLRLKSTQSGVSRYALCQGVGARHQDEGYDR